MEYNVQVIWNAVMMFWMVSGAFKNVEKACKYMKKSKQDDIQNLIQ